MLPRLNGSFKTSSLFLLTAILLFVWEPSGGHAEQTVMEVIPLKHRTAEEVIPILQPFVTEGGAISGMQNKVIISTTPSNLAEIKKILVSIDGELRRLMVTVKQDEVREESGEKLEISGRAVIDDIAGATVGGSGGDRGLTVENKHGEESVRIRAFGVQSPEEDDVIQQVQVLEGNKAFIRIGLSVPLTAYATERYINGRRVIESPEYRDVITGFYVLTRVSGDRVTLDISTHRDRLVDIRTGSTNVQQIETCVSGRLGEWIEIGGLLHQVIGKQSGILHGAGKDSRDLRRVLIRVDELK